MKFRSFISVLLLFSGFALAHTATEYMKKSGLEQFANVAPLSTISYVNKGELKRPDVDLYESDHVWQREDEFGNVYTRYEQFYEGIRVFGAEVTTISFADGRHTELGRIADVNADMSKTSVSMDRAVESVRGYLPKVKLDAELIIWPTKQGGRAAYLVSENSIASRWRVVVDAQNGEFLNAWNQLTTGTGTGVLGDSKSLDTIFSGGSYKLQSTNGNRRTYDANNGTSLPGSLMSDADDNWTDGAGVDAHHYAGKVLEFYSEEFGRNSFDNNGATVISTVHYQNNYVNAFWNGTQMVYGDGDGTTAVALSGGFDVVAHEISHAVTEKTSGLIYQNESGALNEAFSDIMGAYAEFQKQASKADWLMGEDIWTPGTNGDALRYMNNPTQDGSSRDHYSTRYTGSQDNGGVHWNSGIANLAYYLASDGGSHPSQSGPTVTGVGHITAGKIFYNGFVSLSSSATFADARAACEAAASSYSASVQQSIKDAWTAVGVGGSTPPPTGGTLENGVPVSNLSASSGQEIRYTMAVPSGATNLTFAMSGGSGDADLYVKFGSAPTTSSYDYRPYLNGNNETVNVPTAQAGTYHVMVRAYSTFSGVTLQGSYTSTSNQAPNASFSESISDLTVSFTDTSSDDNGITSRSWNFGDGSTSSSTNPSHTYASAGTYTVSLTVTDAGGLSDSASKSITVTAPPTGGSELQNGVAVNGLSAGTGQELHFTMNVPSGASNLTFAMSGGSGDGDLYVKFGSAPTTSSYDYRPYLSGNNETVNVPTAQSGTYYVMIRAYSSFASVSLVGSYTTSGGGGGGTTTTTVSGSLSGKASKYYDLTVSGGVIDLSATFPSNRDIDLYIYNSAGTRVARAWSSNNPETLTYNTNGAAGTYQIRVHNYSSSSSTYNLTVTYQP